MTKSCAFEGCTEDINAWMTYCPQHYAEMMQRQQKAQQPAPQQPIEPQPITRQPQQIQPQPQLPVMPEQVKKEEVKTVKLPKLKESERVIVKQTCLECAVELMKTMDNETKEFNQLMQEMETLVVCFYKIVVKENENLG